MLNYRVVVSVSAELDIHVAGIWYKTRSKQVASKFLDKIDLAFKRIFTNPFAFSRISAKSKYRRYRTPGFPYRIYYYINEPFVEIMAVVHTRRSDKFVNRRLK